MRSLEERVADVRRVLDAAAHVYAERRALVPALVASTGLSAEGVELGFESLEREATDEELSSLVAAAGDARSVHVVLSANVFVAPVRALALACAAAPRVTVRPSSRDPVLAEALVRACRDLDVSIVTARNIAELDADCIHAYGRDETLEALRASARPGVRIVGHGAGLGVALVSRPAPSSAAELLARDVVAFDQRGCLSPRLALVLGGPDGARAFARHLDAALETLQRRVPRGSLAADERAEAARWRESVAFAGELWSADAHTVGLVPDPTVTLVPPPGRHVLVVPVDDEAVARATLAPLSRYVVAVGSDDPAAATRVAPPHARVSPLGRMQRPPLDGPVDRRTPRPSIAVT